MLGVLPGIIGTIQATEAIKLILGIGEPLIGRLLLFDALQMNFRELKLRRDPDCPVCGDHPTITELIDYEQFCGITPRPPPRRPAAVPEIDGRGAEGARSIAASALFILDVREPHEFEICRIPGSTLIPLGELPQRLGEIPQAPDAPDDRRPLQDGRPQRQGGRTAARPRHHQRAATSRAASSRGSTASIRRRASTSGARHARPHAAAALAQIRRDLPICPLRPLRAPREVRA